MYRWTSWSGSYALSLPDQTKMSAVEKAIGIILVLTVVIFHLIFVKVDILHGVSLELFVLQDKLVKPLLVHYVIKL